MCERYNGWVNYETWNMALWLGNDQGLQEECERMTNMAATVGELATMLESFCDDAFLGEDTGTPQTLTTGPLADLLQHAWGKIEWNEIADHYWTDREVDDDSDDDSE
jgi:hypothetical protein